MPRPLRVLQISPYYEGATAYGGIPRAVSALSRALVERGHRVTVCTTDAATAVRRLPAPDDGGRLRPWREVRGGVEVRVFANLSNRLAFRLQLFTPLGLARYLLRHGAGFDLAHVHGCHHLPGVIAARVLGRARVPWLLSPHGTAPRKARRQRAKWLFDATLGRGVLSGAARLLATSQAERRELAALGVDDQERIRTVANAVALDGELPQRGAWRRRQDLGAHPVVLYLGQLVRGKHLPLLLRAFARGAPETATLIIAGPDQGIGRSLARLARELGVASRVRLVGLLEGRQRLAALVDADVVAYPGRGEVFGLVPAEALLCGSPVIVADDGGCAEVLAAAADGDDGGGLAVAEGSEQALAAALSRVLDDPAAWRGRAARAGERLARRFAPGVVAEQAEAVYREVIP